MEPAMAGRQAPMRRRDAIRSIAGAGAIASGCLGAPGMLKAADQAARADIVRFGEDIEPLVRLIEGTPRGDCIEVLAKRLRAGLSHRELLSALFLAGIRNVSPQPPGFKLHCVFVLHSANQLSLDAPYSERPLPLLWALDYFKESQQRDAEEGDFQLREPSGPLPRPDKAWQEFRTAMETWDQERADAAITVLARTKGSHEVIEGLWRYGARDYRNIGHKAIFTANTWRTLQSIGWRHAEPALRSLVMGLLDFGTERRMNGYDFEGQTHRASTETARRALPEMPPGWISDRTGDSSRARSVQSAVRTAGPVAAVAEVATMLADGQGNARDAWDGIHLAAADLMLRLPGILGVHCVTSANALHYAFRMSGDAETRLYLLLQGVGWMSQFATFMARDQAIRDLDLSELERADVSQDEAAGAAEILALVGDEADEAARKALNYATDRRNLTPFFRMARSVLFRKAEESHRFKFAAATFEDLALVSPSWRPHLLAAATYYLQGQGEADSQAFERARKALGAS